MDREQRAEALRTFERATAPHMLVLSLLLLALLAVQLLADLSGVGTALTGIAIGLIWAAFAVQLAVRVYLAPRRGRYLLAHWYDVVIVLLPVLRPLRALLILAAGTRALSSGREVLVRHGLQYALLAAALLVVTAAAAVWYLERGGGGTITGFGVALWWAAVTVTAVGYGDVTPVTAGGRVVAAALMVVGIAVFSIVTANVAAFLVESGGRTRRPPAGDDVAAEVRRLAEQVTALREQVDRIASAVAPQAGSGPKTAGPARRRASQSRNETEGR